MSLNLRPRDRIAICVIALLAVAGAFYLLALKPEQHRASTLAASITSEREALEKAESTYAVGRAAQATLATHAADWSALGRAVPETSDVPALLRLLDHDAAAVHVKMQTIQLSSTASSTPSTTPSTTGGTTGGTTSSAASGPTAIPLEVTFSGGYVALNNLVRRLDSLVTISNQSVQAVGPLLSISTVSLSESPTLNVQLTADIYQLDPDSGPAEASPGGAS